MKANTLLNTVFTLNSRKYNVEVCHNDYGETNKRNRAFVWLHEEDGATGKEHLNFVAEAIYEVDSIYSKKGDLPLLDKAWKRFNRAEVEAERKVLDAALLAIEEDFGYISTDEWRFSRHAGCSCPCSPGFVATSSYGKTIYVNPVKES